MEIFQKTEFKKSYKKLHQNQRAAVNEEIKKIIENPNIGVEKVGDLKGIFVHKFNILFLYIKSTFLISNICWRTVPTKKQ